MSDPHDLRDIPAMLRQVTEKIFPSIHNPMINHITSLLTFVCVSLQSLHIMFSDNDGGLVAQLQTQ